MSVTTYQNHMDAVDEFLREAREHDPERFREVCEKYPTVTRHGWTQIREREQTVGLLGVQPCNISSGTAIRYGLEMDETEDA